MKVNLKKIGAIVAGATILASTAAFGALWYGNTKLVDENGAPVAKVVVGEKAAASDGVGAALIASRMMASAYKTVELKGQVVGTATCTGGEGSGSGTCPISDEKVTLEISVPGAVAEGTYTINTLIGDFLNRRLLDRKDNNESDTDAAYIIGGTDVSENANPFTNGDGEDIGVGEIFLYRVTGSMFSPLATVTVKDDNAGKTYKEEQNIWIKGKVEYSDSANEVVGEPSFLAYTLKFSGAADDFGIPVCTTPNGQDYNACLTDNKSSIDYATSTHKVAIKFLGEDWIISEMTPPTIAGDSETEIYSGGYIKLAKEAISGLINQGESLPVDNLKFHLDDLEAHGDKTSAILSVLDANDNILKKDKVNPGQTKEFNINGKLYRVHVYKVAPGYTFGAKWADMAIYAKELKLEDGQKLDPDYDNNKEYQVILGWKDKGANNVNSPDHLRTIVLYGDDISALSSGGDQKMSKGDYIPIVQDPVVWKLTYAGLDITNADRSSLKFTLERTTNYVISSTKGPLSGGVREQCTISAPYVKVTSGKSGSVFELDGTDGAGSATLADNVFYVATSGAECDDSGVKPDGTVFMKLSPTSQYFGYYEYNDTGHLSTVVRYSTAGDGDTSWDVGGVIEIAKYNDAITAGRSFMGNNRGGTGPSFGTDNLTESGSATDFYFAISEKAGVDTSNNFADYILFGLDLNGASSTFNYDTQTSTGNYITKKDYVLYRYAGPVTTGINTAEEGFVTERGTIFNSIDDTTVSFSMANKLAKAQFTLTSSTAGGSTESTCQATLPEGGEYTCSGVKVKVTKIDETVGACSASGASATCKPDMTGVSAKVVDATGAEVTKAYIPAANAYKGLVILDRDAAGVNTLISVGGDKVNSVTASLLESSPVEWTPGTKIVKEVVQGSKIVVAGTEAEDTLAAVSDFIAAVKEA
ncbi:MAG: hypothetical protein QXY63_03620 [Candidatus Bilamarchaeaceae archaeon]